MRKCDISSRIGYETGKIKYNDEEVNLSRCKMKASNSLIGIICVDIQEGFIIKKNYFTNFNFSQNFFELSTSENISILSDNEINDIAADSKNIVITSKKYIYLFSFDSVWKYKKIKFELSSKYDIDKVSIFSNYISIIGKAISYPYTKAIYVLYFEYEADTEVLYYKTTSKMYQLTDNQMQVECNYCFSLLKISKYNSTICVFISDIDSKSIIALSITTKSQSGLTFSYLSTINLNLSSKSTSFIFAFIGNIIFFADNNSYIYICYQSYRCNSTMTSLEIQGSSITTFHQNYNSISLALLNESKNYIYLIIITINRIQLDISINNKFDSNQMGFIDYSDALCANSSEINTLFISETNSLFLWTSRIKTDYECSSSNLLRTTFCGLTQYYNRSLGKCIECDGHLVSEGIQSDLCQECDINNFCPKYCDEYLEKFGENCENCGAYLQNISNMMNGLSKGDICEVDCGKGNVWTGNKCEEEIFFSGVDNVIKEEDFCKVKTSCYECYYDNRCVWCENLAQCMMASKEINCNKENAIKIKEMFDLIPPQYQCINPEKNVEKIKGKKKIILELDNGNESVLENLKIYKIYFSSVKDVEIEISQFDTNIILDVSLINSLDHPLTAISLSSSESISLSSHLFYILITYKEISPLTITIASSSHSLSTVQIIAIAISNVTFVTIVILLIIFILKRKQVPSNSLKLEQPKIRKINSSKSSLPLSSNSVEISFTNTLKSSSDQETLVTNKLKHLPIFHIDNSHAVFTHYICVFCKEKFIVNNKVCILPCNHIYHYKCLFNQMINIGKIRCMDCGNNIIN